MMMSMFNRFHRAGLYWNQSGSSLRFSVCPTLFIVLMMALAGCTTRSERELRETIADDYSTIVVREGGPGSGDRADDSASEIVRTAFADVDNDPQALPMWVALFDGFSLAMWDLEDAASQIAEDDGEAVSADGIAETADPSMPTGGASPALTDQTRDGQNASPAGEVEPWRVENGVIIASASGGRAASRIQFDTFAMRCDVRPEPATEIEFHLGGAGTLTLTTPPASEEDDAAAEPDEVSAGRNDRGAASTAAPENNANAQGTRDEAAPAVSLRIGERTLRMSPEQVADSLLPAGLWQRIEATVENQQIRVMINGVPAFRVERIQSANEAPTAPPTAGNAEREPIVIDVVEGRTWIRNIFARELPNAM